MRKYDEDGGGEGLNASGRGRVDPGGGGGDGGRVDPGGDGGGGGGRVDRSGGGERSDRGDTCELGDRAGNCDRDEGDVQAGVSGRGTGDMRAGERDRGTGTVRAGNCDREEDDVQAGVSGRGTDDMRAGDCVPEEGGHGEQELSTGELPHELRALSRSFPIRPVDAETMVERVLAGLVGKPASAIPDLSRDVGDFDAGRGRGADRWRRNR
ncbi:hypothetical protein [Streptomyces sp. NPDC048639]|uniref:hypothetical protein n=1 Tax=Streptomyces sp. NPDC048639 TaxID=3365581 RepID=UPI003712A3D9